MARDSLSGDAVSHRSIPDGANRIGWATGIIGIHSYCQANGRGLGAAHDHGVVHRDVKPGNILLGKGTERAVLTDFGIAKIQSDADVTATGVIVGTPAFLSPEQAAGGIVTSQSDLYSLGSVLWTMLAGHPPLANLPTHTVVAEIAAGKMPLLSDHRTGLPPWVYRLVDWMHKVAPHDRPESAHQCAELLRECEQHVLDPIHHRLPPHVSNRKNTRFHRYLYIFIFLVAAGSSAMVFLINRSGFDSDGMSAENSHDVSTSETAVGGVVSQPRSTVEADSQPTDPSIEQLAESVDEIDRELSSVIAELEAIAAEASPTHQQLSPREK